VDCARHFVQELVATRLCVVDTSGVQVNVDTSEQKEESSKVTMTVYERLDKDEAKRSVGDVCARKRNGRDSKGEPTKDGGQ
jgi:ornithine cyclodeaminase/alanine dehydrogenase-like protein (mu-crystallin family)